MGFALVGRRAYARIYPSSSTQMVQFIVSESDGAALSRTTSNVALTAPNRHSGSNGKSRPVRMLNVSAINSTSVPIVVATVVLFASTTAPAAASVGFTAL